MLKRYVLRRLALMIPLLLGISVLSFAIIHLVPGGPVQAETAMNSKLSPASVEALKELYGFNDPLWKQYGKWLLRLLSFDFGHSFHDQRPVLDKILEALPATLLLSCLSLTIAFGIGVPLGVFEGAKEGTKAEHASSLFSFIAYSTPTFWLALLAQILFGLWWGILPVSGYRSLEAMGGGAWEACLDIAWHLVLPLAVSSFGAWAAISRYTRGSVLEALSQDYVRTARAKGLGEREVLWRHVLPNALLPIITILGMAIPDLLSGSVVIETIFSWPGMGRLAWDAATAYDYPVVMGLTMVGAVLTITGNFAADLAYAWLDPRVRYE